MPLLRIRTEIEDRPGRLARLTAALAERGANILGLSVQVGPGGVVDEFVVSVPDPAPGDPPPARALAEAIAAAGGARTAVVPGRPRELVDEPTRALTLAARLCARPQDLPEVLAELLRAHEASWITAPADDDGAPDVLTVPVGERRAVRLRRYGLPFTATEAARADALVRAALPAPSPAPASRTVVLRDGTRAVVRPIRPQDADAVLDLHARCSPESRRMRYFSATPAPPPRAMRDFTDPAHGLTLVAEGPDGSLLALAHLIHVLEPGVAELAFLVADAWQGRGLGRALTELLVVLARERGLVELRAAALAENRRVLRLLMSLGGRVRRTDEPGVVEVRLRLDGRDAAPSDRAAAAASR